MAGYDLTPYITPTMLLANSYGISWNTFPKPGASEPEQVAAQLDICWTVTSTMDTLANQALRATVDTEAEFGPDFVVTVLRNGWARFRLSHWPISQLVSAQVSPAGSVPPQWLTIPTNALQTEHQGLPPAGTIVPDGAGPGPTAALIAPGYVTWALGRKGYYVQVTSVNGFPTCGIDQPAVAGDTSLHVDDITGWWNGTAGARGTIYDPPFRETVTVSGVTPDTTGALQGPGTLTLANPLKFPHTPVVDQPQQPDEKVLLSSMPQSLIQAGYYLATHYGLIRGSTAGVVQTVRGQGTSASPRSANDWYEQAQRIIERYGRVF